jgi:phospholipid-binding lipoprotein MlaA
MLTVASTSAAMAQDSPRKDSVTGRAGSIGAEGSEVYDPFEDVNRRLYSVHDVLDRWIVEPVARGYRYVTPRPLRGNVRNFLSNLNAPVVFANTLLQGEPRRAGATAARFGVNTTLGVLGLFDPAESIGLEEQSEDFGQTLAVWGMHEGPYIFVPLLGPTNLRDGFGHVVDNFLDPLSWATFEGDSEFALTRGVAGALSMREELIEPIDAIRSTSIDPYARFRSTYALIRNRDISNAAPAFEELPDFNAPDFNALEGAPPAPLETAPEASDDESLPPPPPVVLDSRSVLTAGADQ